MELFRGPVDYDAIESVPLEQRIPYASVHDMFAQRAAAIPDAPAIFWLPDGIADAPFETISFAMLFARINQTANLLHSLGVRPEAGVSILMPNCPETYYAIWGGSAAGVANPVNPLLTPGQIADIMAAAGSRVLITGGPGMSYDVFEKARAVREIYPALEQVVVVNGGGIPGMIDFHEGIARQPSTHLVSGRVFSHDEPSVYFHTGGTTGAPKLAQQTHLNQLFTAWTCSFLFALSGEDRILTGLPLFHANAAISTGLAGFFGGASAILCGEQGYRNKAMMADFWPIVSRFRATLFSGVPTIYASLLEQLPNDLDVSSLRFAVCGAAPMPVSLFRAFEERTGVKILEAYGMTEGGAASTINPRDGERRIGSVGVRLPYQRLRPVILDADGNYVRDCGDDEVGALLLSGPNVFPGYRQKKHNQNLWPQPGWFNSGDLGRRDTDGYFWLAGRAKDLIIRSGHNIDPATIEETLHRHPDVELAAAIGKPCAYAGEVPIAYVRLRQGATASPEELIAFARAHIAERPAAPAEIIVVDQMPVTAVGKIFKPPLREDAVARTYGAALADLPVRVTARHDEKRGLIADISGVTDQAAIDLVESRLGRFPVPYNILPLAESIAP